jgi:hypothetical protein
MTNTTVGVGDCGVTYGLTGNSKLVETTSGGLLTASIIPAATTGTIGGVIVGTGLSVTTGTVTPTFGTATNQVAEGGVITAAGPIGTGALIPVITYNAAGQLTTVTTTTNTPAIGSVSGLGTGVATAAGDAVNGSGGFATSAVTSLGSLTTAAGGAFGTAAYVATGTSGGTIPLLNGTNTWSGVQTYGAGDFVLTGAVNGDIGTFNSSHALVDSGTLLSSIAAYAPNVQTGSTYSVQASDNNKAIIMEVAAAGTSTVTIPVSIYPISFLVCQGPASGVVTVVGSSTTITSPGSASLVTYGANVCLGFVSTGVNTYIAQVPGNPAATGLTVGTSTIASGTTLRMLYDNAGVLGEYTAANVSSYINSTVAPVLSNITGAGTGILTALGINVGTAGSVVVNGGALGTPSSGTGTNLTGIPNAAVAAAPLPTPGSGATLAAPRSYYVCTTTCTMTIPVPAAGDEFCVMNDDNVSTKITLSNPGTGVQYENTARTAYGTATSGTLVSGGAAGDKICIVGRDATHYLSVSYVGTWVAS